MRRRLHGRPAKCRRERSAKWANIPTGSQRTIPLWLPVRVVGIHA
jgi:hypothetical protein